MRDWKGYGLQMIIRGCRRRWKLPHLSQGVRFSTTFAQESQSNEIRHVLEKIDSGERENIKEAFDGRIRRNYRSGSLLSPTGLFGNPLLKEPKDLVIFAQAKLRKSKKLTARIEALRGTASPKQIVKNFDILSDTLCSVIDLAECVRNTHPDAKFVEAADTAFATLYDFMNVLNTHQGLFYVIRDLVSDQQAFNGLTNEEQAVALVYLHDFEKSGITLDGLKRQQFVDLNSEIASLGRVFASGLSPKSDFIVVNEREAGPDQSLLIQLGALRRGSSFYIPTYGPIFYNIMVSLPSEPIRRKLFTASMVSSEEQVQNLDQLLGLKNKLGRLVGYDSYGALQLNDKMASNPENVLNFLHAMMQSNLSSANKEMELLQRLKEQNGEKGLINAWEKDRLCALYVKQSDSMSSNNKVYAPLSQFLTIGTVMQGLSEIFTMLYGIRFVPREVQPGEMWDESVQRLDIVDEKDGHIGIIYCDLFAREGKMAGAAHFTIRCSRRIDDDEEIEDTTGDGWHGALKGTPNGQTYQMPTIALFCDFSPSISGISSLSVSEVETLFHEFGHAIHSMVGRTAYQNLAGTRCATDFVELPSVFMERFVKSPHALPLFARHHRTNEPLDFQNPLWQRAIKSHFASIDTHQQIMFALLDQHLHSHEPSGLRFSSTDVFQSIQSEFSLFPVVEGTSWQAQFGHLHGYGSSYYSYLFDRAIAAKVWQSLFAQNPLSRMSGEKFKSEILQWGGSRDPWLSLSRLLHDESIEGGGPKATETIGRWGQEMSSLSR